MTRPYVSRHPAMHFAGAGVVFACLLSSLSHAQQPVAQPANTPGTFPIEGPKSSPPVAPLPAASIGIVPTPDAPATAPQALPAVSSAKPLPIIAKRIEPIVPPARRVLPSSTASAPASRTATVIPSTTPASATTFATRKSIAAAKPALPGRQSLGALLPACKTGLRLNTTGNKCEPIPRTANRPKPAVAKVAAHKSAASQPRKR